MTFTLPQFGIFGDAHRVSGRERSMLAPSTQLA
jgi:hypothetical protein